MRSVCRWVWENFQMFSHISLSVSLFLSLSINVCLSLHYSCIYLFFCLLSIALSSYLSIPPSIHPSFIWLPIHPFLSIIHFFIQPSTCFHYLTHSSFQLLFIHLPIFYPLFIQHFTYPFHYSHITCLVILSIIHQTIHPSFLSSICPSIPLCLVSVLSVFSRFQTRMSWNLDYNTANHNSVYLLHFYIFLYMIAKEKSYPNRTATYI